MDWVTCALCGCEFDPENSVRCGGCILKSKCETVCCPRCGYETVFESSLTRLAKKLIGLRGRKPAS